MLEKKIKSKEIKLGSFLKYIGACSSGAQAKDDILQGKIKVSGEVCFQRGRKLKDGDIVKTATSEEYKVKVIEPQENNA